MLRIWRSCKFYSAPTRQHELDRTRSGIDLPCLADIDHEIGIDELSEVCNHCNWGATQCLWIRCIPVWVVIQKLSDFCNRGHGVPVIVNLIIVYIRISMQVGQRVETSTGWPGDALISPPVSALQGCEGLWSYGYSTTMHGTSSPPDSRILRIFSSKDSTVWSVGYLAYGTVFRASCTDFVSLVVVPFVFWAVQTSNVQRLVGLSFFSAAQNVIGFYLASSHVWNNASEGEPCNSYTSTSYNIII